MYMITHSIYGILYNTKTLTRNAFKLSKEPPLKLELILYEIMLIMKYKVMNLNQDKGNNWGKMHQNTTALPVSALI